MCPQLENEDNGDVGREEGPRRGDAGQCDQGDKIWEGWMEEGFGSSKASGIHVPCPTPPSPLCPQSGASAGGGGEWGTKHHVIALALL